MPTSDYSPDTIFKFAILRDPQRYPSEAKARRFVRFASTASRARAAAGTPDLLTSLARARAGKEPAAVMAREVTQFKGGPLFVPSVTALYSTYTDFTMTYEQIRAADRTMTIAALTKAIETPANVTLAVYATDPPFSDHDLTLWENLIAQILAPGGPDLRQELINVIRINWIVRRLLVNDPQLQNGQDVYEAARATVLLPADIFPVPRGVDVVATPSVPLYRLYNAGVDDHFYTTAAAERTSAIAASGYADEGIAAHIYDTAVAGTTPLFRLLNRRTSDHFYTTSVQERSHAVSTFGYVNEGVVGHVFPLEVPGSTPLYRTLNAARTHHFYTTSPSERDKAVSLGHSSEGVACFVFPPPAPSARPGSTQRQTDLVRIGSVVLELNRLCVDPMPAACTPYQYAHWPRTWGRVQPSGIADFKSVQTQLLLYAKGEIAQIENLMGGEKNTRVVRNFDRREEVAMRDVETTTTTEKESQTNDKNELARESSEVLKEDMKLDVGVKMSASFGPVSLEVNTGFAYQNSKETSNKVATKVAKEVMNRALVRVSERVREQRTVTTVHETEDTVTHTLENKGTVPTSAIYRWVDKYYLARLINYGPRLMFDFIVPEPAAFYIFSVANRRTEGAIVPKPVPPWQPTSDSTLAPSTGLKSFRDIIVPSVLTLQSPASVTVSPSAPLTPPTPSAPALPATVAPSLSSPTSNWERWAAVYKVQNLQPPPAEYTTASVSLSASDHDDGRSAATNEKLVVPIGYQAVGVTITFTLYMGGVGDSDHVHPGNWVEGQVGNVTFDFQIDNPGQNILRRSMAYETGMIPVSLRADSKQFAINVEVLCQRTPESVDQWRINTFNAIMAGYEAQQQAYDGWLKSQQAQPGVEIPGHNPDANREVEKEELKKACLELLTEQRLDSFDAVQPVGGTGPNAAFSFPEINFQEAADEARYIRFFEHAFEWPLLSYIFYPYFWGRKPNWVMVKQFEDPDPLFTKFLQAGAARVLVPVRDSFRDAVMHYLSNGAIWDGGDVPTLDDPLYVSIADEMKEAAGHFRNPKLVDQWPVKLPTNFVIIDDPGNTATLPDNRVALQYTGNLIDDM